MLRRNLELIVFPPILNTSNKRIGLSVTHVADRRRSLSTVFVRGKLEKKKRQDSIERFHRISSSIGFRISVNLWENKAGQEIYSDVFDVKEVYGHRIQSVVRVHVALFKREPNAEPGQDKCISTFLLRVFNSLNFKLTRFFHPALLSPLHRPILLISPSL